MGFINYTAGTFNAEAILTDYGKEKLYESIEGGQVGDFVTQFALGDSDTDYDAVDLGATGRTKIADVPRNHCDIKNKILYKGTYPPGKPIILIDGSDIQTSSQISIGAFAQGGNKEPLVFRLNTEWPKAQSFEELYTINVIPPSNFTNAAWNKMLKHSVTKTETGAELKISFDFSESNIRDLNRLTGLANDLQTDFTVLINGADSDRRTSIQFTMVW